MNDWRKYRITEKAGRMVAGGNNTGVGNIVHRRRDLAADAVKRGELVPVRDQDDASKPKSKAENGGGE